jgi:hypothetical protein
MIDNINDTSKENTYRGRPVVTDAVYKDFIKFVMEGVNSGVIKPEEVYAPQLQGLEDQLEKMADASAGAATASYGDANDNNQRQDRGGAIRERGEAGKSLLQVAEKFRHKLAGQVKQDLALKGGGGASSSHGSEVKAALEEAILSRYLPESELRRLSLARDHQLEAAVSLVADRPRYDALLSAPPSLSSVPSSAPASSAPSSSEEEDMGGRYSNAQATPQK